MQVGLVDALLSSCRSLAVPCGHGVSVYSTETGECVVEMHHHRDAVTGAVLGRNRLQVILRGGSWKEQTRKPHPNPKPLQQTKDCRQWSVLST